MRVKLCAFIVSHIVRHPLFHNLLDRVRRSAHEKQSDKCELHSRHAAIKILATPPSGRDCLRIQDPPSLSVMAELDVDLLSKFRCMGTTDRDVLIEELHALLSGQVSRGECTFILEMSNW